MNVSKKKQPAAKPSAAKPAKTVRPKPAAERKTAPAPGAASLTPLLEALRKDIAGLQSSLAKVALPAAPSADRFTEETDAVRRLLNDVIEQRVEPVVRDLAAIRNTAASFGGDAGAHLTEAVDQVLENLDAVKFEAHPLDHVDPLIYTVARETRDDRHPDGVVTETLRPGYRTCRGVVVAKALVAVNRRA
jgi:molecular chaperone GrpE (heat shock protein)